MRGRNWAAMRRPADAGGADEQTLLQPKTAFVYVDAAQKQPGARHGPTVVRLREERRVQRAR